MHMQRTKHYLSKTDGDISTFKQSVEKTTHPADYPLATNIQQNAVIYSNKTVLDARKDSDKKQALMAEWIKVWLDGPGVLMIAQAMDADTIDRTNTLFDSIIRDQKNNQSAGGGDHFAKAGANDRIWNALGKHALADPEGFACYYANEALALASEAWLGTGYQVTAQVNRVNPGGAAQTAHRDYHLGFMAADQIVKYPTHVHLLSPVLTLQGAIAHCDMPKETGPTLYLPYSQNYPEGYLAFGRDEFQEYFNQHRSQLELSKGDMVFFNPALMHAAGENTTTDRYRLANLLQVSSAFGKPIESVDHLSAINTVYPALLKLKQNQLLTDSELNNVICACTDGYPFPTNLDHDLPEDGLAPRSQQQRVLAALSHTKSHHLLMQELNEQQLMQRQTGS